MEGLALIENKTKDYAESYGKLKEKVSQLDEEIAALKKKYLPSIKKYANEVAEKHSVLAHAIETNPGLFEKPRTVIFHGIKVGLQKGRGKMEYDDKQTVKLIKKHFPEKEDILIQVIEKPIKTALNQLSIGELKKIAVHVVEAQDEPVIKSTDSDIEKMVNALIEEDKKMNEEKSAA